MKVAIPPKTIEASLVFSLRLAALRACRGNRTHAAIFCGVTDRTMRTFARACREARIDIWGYDSDTRGIEGQQNRALEAIARYVYFFPKGEDV